MSATPTNYSARFRLPTLIQRGVTQRIACPIYRDGALVAPMSGTITLRDAAGALVVDAAAVSVVSSIAEYAVVTSSTIGLEEGWQVVWTFVIDAATTLTFRNEAALVRQIPYPPCSDVALFARVSSLNPSGSNPITSLANYQTYLDEAWVEIRGRLIAAGNRPELVISSTALRRPHLLLTLALIFEDLATRLNEAHEARAAHYRAEYDLSWSDVRFEYDADDDGLSDGRDRRPGTPVVWLGSQRGSKWLV